MRYHFVITVFPVIFKVKVITVEPVLLFIAFLKDLLKNNNIRWLKTVFSTIWTSRYNHSFEAIIMASKKPRPMIGEHVIIF